MQVDASLCHLGCDAISIVVTTHYKFNLHHHENLKSTSRCI